MSAAGEKRTLEETDGEASKEANGQPVPSSEPAQEAAKLEEPAAKRTRAEEEEKPNGVATQSESATQAPPAAQPPVFHSDPSGWPEGMKPSVRERLETLFASGKCRRDEIDFKIMQSLAEFSEASALQILINFGDADMASIRNKSAFLAGVMKRFRTENPLGGSHAVPSMGAYGPGLGLTSSFSGDSSGMIPGVQARLESLFATGKVRIAAKLPIALNVLTLQFSGPP
jgi:hypothetical protein